MKDITIGIKKVLFYIFCATVLIFTASLTYMLAGRLIPGNIFMQIMTVILFDLGALLWFIAFIDCAKGTFQWVIAGIGFGVGLAGAIVMAAGELILGQNLVSIQDPTKLGWIIIATVIVAALVHAVAIYAYHFLNPHVKNKIDLIQIVAKKTDQAYEAAKAKLEHESNAMRDAICDAAVAEGLACLEEEIGFINRRSNRRALDSSKKSGLPPILAGIARDVPVQRPDRPAPPPTSQARDHHGKQPRPPQKDQKNPSPRPVVSNDFGGNGHSAEHAAFAADVKMADRQNPTPPPSGSNR